MRVCLIQTDPQFKQRNLSVLGRVIQNTPADLYVLPELFTIGFFPLAAQWPVGAEPFPKGHTCEQVSCLLGERSSTVICGLLEQHGPDFYNIGAVISRARTERYRQKYPSSATVWKDHDGTLRSLPLSPGGYEDFTLPCARKIGLMVCHDYFAAKEFFEEYRERGVDCVVLIADSISQEWLGKFQECCRKYKLSAIICNSAGAIICNSVRLWKGNSCILNTAGDVVTVVDQNIRYTTPLPAKEMAVVGTI